MSPDLTSDDVLVRLRARYTGEPVPPCRVCSGKLGISRLGGGDATKYNCTQAKPGQYKWGTPEQRAASDHYQRSEWRDTRPGDSDVIALLDLLDTLETQIALLHGGAPDA